MHIPSAQVDPNYVYSQTGGCRWGESYGYGSWNATWPFATLRLSVETLVVTIDILGFHREYEFTPKDVVAIRKFSGFLSWGIQVEHTKAGYPQFIVFWSFNRGKLLQMAKRAGFPAEAA